MNRETPSPQAISKEPKLKRDLGLWDVIFYGIVLIQPIGAIGMFGIATEETHGHMVTTLLIAMVAMMLTAVSYGRMASRFPSAGSAYTYVSKGLNPHIGFLAGWAMFLDYLVVPVINTVFGSLALQRLIPVVPFTIWIILFVLVITFLNLRGVRSMARSNELMLGVMLVVIGIFFVLAVKYIASEHGWSALFTYKPVFNPGTFEIGAVMTATSYVALTYIGFDGVTTLSEEVKNPRRNMLLAPVLVCLITGILGCAQIYLAQLVSPDVSRFPNIETAFFDVTRIVGGEFLFDAFAIIMVIACLGSGLSGQGSAARLLFGMGRDGILPFKFFSHLSPGSRSPVYNIVFMAILTFIISLLVSYKLAAELLNFGAFLAFMGVNIATFRIFYLLNKERKSRNILIDALIPLLGFLFCFSIWINLHNVAKIAGGGWLLIGVVYLGIKTRGFKLKPKTLDFDESQ